MSHCEWHPVRPRSSPPTASTFGGRPPHDVPHHAPRRRPPLLSRCSHGRLDIAQEIDVAYVNSHHPPLIKPADNQENKRCARGQAARCSHRPWWIYAHASAYMCSWLWKFQRHERYWTGGCYSYVVLTCPASSYPVIAILTTSLYNDDSPCDARKG